MQSNEDSAILKIDNTTNIDLGQTVNTTINSKNNYNNRNDNSLDTAENASKLLQFQDFPRTSDVHLARKNSTPSPSAILIDSDRHSPGDDVNDDDETDVLLNGSNSNVNSKTQSVHAFWELSYFAQYFDVSTSQVISRIIYSMIPFRFRSQTNGGNKGNYIERHIQANADFYGPFWINVTLIFTIAIFGNISEYLRSQGATQAWHYDFHKLSLAASTIFTYTVVVPVILWFFFWFRGCLLTYTLFEIICAYGYSISVYIPIAILWLINIPILKVISMIVGASLSGTVLTLSFAPVVQSDPANTFKTSYFILILIIVLHISLAVSLYFYFF